MREAHGHIPQKGCELHLGRVEITHNSWNVTVLCRVVILSITVHGTWLFPLSRYIKERGNFLFPGISRIMRSYYILYVHLGNKTERLSVWYVVYHLM